jgi:hypothetical protein
VVIDLARETDAFAAIRREARNASPKGVVIVGRYDVVPSERYDTLPPSLRASIGASARNDPDNFIVWSDQSYGDLDGDHLADVPVSRIPDGHTAEVVEAAFRHTNAEVRTGFGGVSSDLPFKALQILQHHGIIADKYILSPHSVNLFVAVESREAAVKALHSLVL